MSTRTEHAGQPVSTQTQPLVKISEMDHIVLRVKDVEVSLDFYTRLLGLTPERVEEWRAGDVRFPSATTNRPSAGKGRAIRTISAWSSNPPTWKR